MAPRESQWLTVVDWGIGERVDDVSAQKAKIRTQRVTFGEIAGRAMCRVVPDLWVC